MSKRVRVQRRDSRPDRPSRHPEWVLNMVGGDPRPDLFARVPHISNWGNRRMFFRAMRADTIAQAEAICRRHVREHMEAKHAHVRHLPEMTGAYTLRVSGGRVAV